MVQVSNWFINARVRLWKPMVEEMYQQESKDEDDDIHNNNNNTDDDTSQTTHQITPNPISQTPPPHSAAAHTRTTQTDRSNSPIPKHQHYSSAAVTQAAPPPPMVAQCYPPSHYDSELQDTCRRVGVVLNAPDDDHEFGTTTASATSDIHGPTRLVRFGTTTGDVSLTLGLRHAGNIPDNNPSFSLRSEFGGC